MEKPSEDKAEFITEDLDELHQRVMLECANAIDEASYASNSNRHELEDGRVLYDTRWLDADDIRCGLNATTKIDPRFILNKPDEQKLRTDYFFRFDTSMPNVPRRRYYFTSIKPIAQLCDESGRGIPNDSPDQDVKNFKIILDSLIARPTRQEPSEEIKTIALEHLMTNVAVIALIKRIDLASRHLKNRITTEKAVELIMKKEPMLSEESVRRRIEIEQIRLREAN